MIKRIRKPSFCLYCHKSINKRGDYKKVLSQFDVLLGFVHIPCEWKFQNKET